MRYLMAILFMIATVACICGCTGTDVSAVLVEYHRSGGIAGFDDHLVIHENGSASLTTRRGSEEFMVNRSTRDQIHHLFDQAQFSRLHDEYPAPQPGADYFTYVITYRGHTVTTEDTGVPEELEPIIRLLNDLAGEAMQMP